jgi:quercetin dioxygenase-like cupin family protein
MKNQYRFFANLVDEVSVAKESIVSRTLNSDAGGKTILFGFDTGQELSEHTSSIPASLHILKGEGLLTLGEESYEIREGAFAIMQANVSHSIVAKTPMIMLLYMQGK